MEIYLTHRHEEPTPDSFPPLHPPLALPRPPCPAERAALRLVMVPVLPQSQLLGRMARLAFVLPE